ncbi:MAG: haloalkane dehalogenase [Myxococcota bacterium]
MRHIFPLTLVICTAIAGCGNDDDGGQEVDGSTPCDAEPVVMTTNTGVDFVRTPDSCFESLPGWSFAPQSMEIDGLRQAYVDEGPADGPVVLLLHGQPSWSYLYRKMIPVLVEAGYRVIAMDHLGMGRSDKPTDIASYSYLGHADRLERFIEALELRDINLFVQDWGSVLGLRVAGLHPDWFARIAVGNGILPVIPEGMQPYPSVEDPDQIEDIPSSFEQMPAQQVPFYDGCDLLQTGDGDFGDWMIYAMKAESFHASEVIEALTWFDLPTDEEAAYDAPFPSRTYMAGARVFPSLVNELPGVTEEAWAGLTSFERPFLTLWAANDPGGQGSCEAQQLLVSSVPGAAGQPHDRLPEASHFLQDDQGEEIGERLVEFFASEPVAPFGPGSRYCEILLVKPSGTELEAEVWGTQGLGDCPAASWEAIDTEAIKYETGALEVILNGPRYWLNRSVGALPSMELQTFGDLEMRRLATVEIDPSQSEEPGPYTESTVLRTTTYTYRAGEEIYELTSPEGVVYVMQSMSQIADPDLVLADLPTLGERLVLPAGWTYTARTLDADLIMTAEGEATVLQDDLTNTYQRE